jgi:hypothetical protein
MRNTFAVCLSPQSFSNVKSCCPLCSRNLETLSHPRQFRPPMHTESVVLSANDYQTQIECATHLPSTRMQKPDVLPSHDMNQFARLDVSDLDEAWLKRQDIWVIQRKTLWCTLPLNLPIRPCTPAISVDEETEVGIIEQELPIQTFYVNGLHAFFSRHKIE